MNTVPKKICAIKMCNKQAEFYCGGCQGVDYCSKQHQDQDWYAGHKKQCGNVAIHQMKQELQLQYKNRVNKRKQYYSMFLAHRTDQLLYTVRDLEKIEARIDVISKNQFDDQFQLAATACLYIKTLIEMNQKLAAKTKLDYFLNNNRIILETMRLPVKGKVTQQSKKFFLNKLNLIATLANLSYNLDLSPIPLYIKYLQNIQMVFGKQSMESSNCYFLMGEYYYDQQHYVKAIACFKRAALMRNQQGTHECNLNIGVCYKILKRHGKAIQTFMKALQKLTQNHNQYTQDAAQLYQYLAITHMEELNLIDSIKFLELAYLIRSKAPESQKFIDLNKLINFFFEECDNFLVDPILERQKPHVYKYLKENILTLKLELQDKIEIKKQEEQVKENEGQGHKQNPVTLDQQKIIDTIVTIQFKDDAQMQTSSLQSQNRKMKLSKRMLDSLNHDQISYLAKLQLELQNAQTKFMIISVYNKSQFMRSLTEQQLQQFKKQNQDTLRDMNIVNPVQIQPVVQTVQKKKGKQKKTPTLNLAGLPKNK